MSEATTDSTPVLAFDDVSVESAPGYDHGIRGLSLSLRPGDCCLVRLEWESLRSPLCDLACGILEPDRGAVKFAGTDWTRMGFGQANRDRGRIGRTFEGIGWVANLDVDENVILAERHHTWRSDSDLLNEAETLAREFGLQSLPKTRPALTRRQDLARASLARAFMGSPKLLLLERPEMSAFPAIVPSLLRQVNAARDRGAAVLWLTDRPEVWQDVEVRPTQRFSMAADTLVSA